MDVEAGPSSKGPASRDREARQICRTFRDEQYEMDEIANAVCDGGLSAGYAVFLQKFENFTLPGVPRIWINAPKSQVGLRLRPKLVNSHSTTQPAP